MKFLMFGSFAGAAPGTDWVAFMNHNHTNADGKLKQLGVQIESLYLTLAGPHQFVVGVEAPSTEAMFAFQLWYNCQGRGSIQIVPAYTLEQGMAAAAKA